MKVLKIDNDGFFIEDVILEEGQLIPIDCIEMLCPSGFYKPKWNNIEWVEGLTQEEIDIIKNRPIEKTELEILKAELIDQKERFRTMEEDSVGFQDFILETIGGM